MEYWIVDPNQDIVRVYRKEGDAFAGPVKLARTRGEVLRTALFAGLELPLARIFEE